MQVAAICIALVALLASYQCRSAEPAAVARTFVETVTGIRFVLIPAGRFMRGSSFFETQPAADQKWFTDEAPPRSIGISRSYWLASTETTTGAFRSFVDETGYATTAERAGSSLGAYTISIGSDGQESGQWTIGQGLSWRTPGWSFSEAHPVVHVSWADAVAFVQWLRDKTGRPFRLPTEAEWEYAAGGPAHTVYAWGNQAPVTGREANIADLRFASAYPLWKYPVLRSIDDGFVHTAPVGAFEANGFGLFDMTGNVWEWCVDRYAAEAYVSGPDVDPQGPSDGTERVHRGGGFDWELPYLRVAKRRRGAEDMTAANIGFRLALDAEKVR